MWMFNQNAVYIRDPDHTFLHVAKVYVSAHVTQLRQQNFDERHNYSMLFYVLLNSAAMVTMW